MKKVSRRRERSILPNAVEKSRGASFEKHPLDLAIRQSWQELVFGVVKVTARQKLAEERKWRH